MNIKELMTGMSPMSLETFATRFGIVVDHLKWGVVIITRGEKTEMHCAVLIEGAPVYIHIAEDAMTLGLSRTGCRIERIPCKLEETETHFILINKKEGIEMTLGKENVAEFYASKILSLSTRKYIGGSYWDI
ncbi:MAG: hypothetical protein LBP64_03880 [Tannerella sp.]|jgi:hypothetical protein|nr:hypothetical protein [Tannerella sp.]